MPLEVRAGAREEIDVMAELGRAALLLSFGLIVYALVAGSLAAWKRRRRLALSAQNALIAAFGTTVVAALVLWAALARRDFGFEYVAGHTSRELPLGYRLAAFWSGQEGSLLLWLLILTGYAALAVWLNRRTRDLVVWAVPVLAGVATFFVFMLCFISSPFKTAAGAGGRRGHEREPAEPVHARAPAACSISATSGSRSRSRLRWARSCRGRTDERWIVVTRRWTLAAWTFLGVGQLIGSHWAYVEIGWGGYYAWDPVENAALMPWLAATAFLHSVMIQEKRGMLKVWNMVLVALAFNLSIFGTFLTRSGVINSIHSFAQSSIGGWFLGFIVICVTFSVVLIYVRLPLLRTKTKLESLVSREATFLYNNLLLVALCLTILWGVMYPVLTEAVRGETRSVSKPYYNFFLHSFGLPLLLLMGIGPLVAWRRASLRALGKTFLVPAIAAVATGVILIALGFGSSTPGPARVHVRRVRRGVDRARVRARNPRPSLPFRRLMAGRARRARRPQPAPIRRLHHPRVDPDARDRHRGIERVPDRPRARPSPRPVDGGRGLHAHVSASSDTAGGERRRNARGGRRHARRVARHDAASRQERLPGRAAGVERGLDLSRSRGTSAICSRSPTRSTRSRMCCS